MAFSLRKILGRLFFTGLIGLIIYLVIDVDEVPDPEIQLIELNGNYHLNKDQYYEYAHLTDRKKYFELNVKIIKDRLEKHPYVQLADVKINRSGKVYVELKEKRFKSLLLVNNEQYLLTEDLNSIKVLPVTRNLNYPVLSNPAGADEIKSGVSLRRNIDVITGLKMVDAMQLLNPALSAALSEIDLRDGKDIIVTFSKFDFPVIFGRGAEIRKTAYLNAFWTKIENSGFSNLMEYLDLRYGHKMFIGFPEIGNDSGVAA